MSLYALKFLVMYINNCFTFSDISPSCLIENFDPLSLFHYLEFPLHNRSCIFHLGYVIDLRCHQLNMPELLVIRWLHEWEGLLAASLRLWPVLLNNNFFRSSAEMRRSCWASGWSKQTFFFFFLPHSCYTNFAVADLTPGRHEIPQSPRNLAALLGSPVFFNYR
jgi:hypothetical protein